MNSHNRRTALLSLVTGIGGVLGLRSAGAAEAVPIPGAREVFLSGKAVRVDVQSAPVRWHDYDYHLVRIGEISFFRSPLGRLTATVNGSTTTFDNVEYDVYAAVYDEAGNLLGTARALCSVERLWLGKVGTTPMRLALDFGISKAYERARWFTLGISERDVLTPDQWQKP